MTERLVAWALYAQTVRVMLEYYINNAGGPNVRIYEDDPEEAGYVCAKFVKKFLEGYIEEGCGPNGIIEVDQEHNV